MTVENFDSLLDEAPRLSQPSARGELFLPVSHMRLLEKLEHLSRYSHFVQIVVGLPGCGKTTLSKQFTPSADDRDVQACSLRGAADVDERGLLRLLVDQLSLDVAADADANTLVAALLDHARLLAQMSRILLIIVDDAEEFSEPVLALLFRLLQQGADPAVRPHLVLFGAPRLKEVLKGDAFQSVMSSSAHLMELEPLSFEEMQGFIAHRFGGAAGGLGERELKKLYNETFGLPGRIPRVLEQVLEGAAPLPERDGRHRSPVLRRGAVILAAVAFPLVAGVAWLGLNSDEAKGRLRVLLPAPVISQANPAAANPVVEQETLEQRLERVRVALEHERARAEAPAEMAQVVVAAETVSQEAPPPNVIPASQLPLAPIKAVSAAPLSVPSKRVLALPPLEPSATESVATEVQAEVLPVAADDSVHAREQELLSWNATGYTLQMLGARQADSVERFVSNQSVTDQFYQFSTIYKGKPWYVVVYGQYPDREAAVAAIANLPLELRKRRPWARSVQGVQEDIRRKK